MRATIIFLVCGVSFLAWEWPTQARPKKRSEDPAIAAKKACAEGDFRKGVSILADLYVQTDETTFIYNQGRCYEQNHQWAAAIDRFREYLRKTRGAGPDVTAETEKHIAECKGLLDEEQARNQLPPSPSPPTPMPAPPVLADPPTAHQQTSASITNPPAPVVESGSSLRTTGIVVGSIGLATLAAAIALNVQANHLAHDGDESGQKSYQSGSLACYGVGGAAVVAGVVLYFVGHKSVDARPTGVALLPTWTSAGPAIAITGDF
jgi:hypothetical protein